MESVVCLTPPCVTGALTDLDLLQSGIDKIVDRRGNVEWLTGYFARSPLASQVLPMLGVITVIEVAAGTLSALGVPVLLLTGKRTPAALGALLAVTAILALFFGMRMAEDYAGAAGMVPYFILAGGALGRTGMPP